MFVVPRRRNPWSLLCVHKAISATNSCRTLSRSRTGPAAGSNSRLSTCILALHSCGVSGICGGVGNRKDVPDGAIHVSSNSTLLDSRTPQRRTSSGKVPARTTLCTFPSRVLSVLCARLCLLNLPSRFLKISAFWILRLKASVPLRKRFRNWSVLRRLRDCVHQHTAHAAGTRTSISN
jgi:hypothetical protein